MNTMLLALVMVGVTCAGNAAEADRLEQAKRQQEAAKTLQMYGCCLRFEDGSPCLPSTPLSKYETKSITDIDIGEEELALDAPKGLSVNDCMAQLKQFPMLRHLSLTNPSIDNGMLKNLEPSDGLKDIGLQGTKVTEDGVRWLRKRFPLCRIVNYDQPVPADARKPKPSTQSEAVGAAKADFTVVAAAKPTDQKPGAATQREIAWLPFSAQALGESVGNGRTVLLYLRSSKCRICKRAEADLWGSKEIQRQFVESGVVPMTLDIDDLQAIAGTGALRMMKLLNITRLPSIAVLSGSTTDASVIVAGDLLNEQVVTAILKSVKKPEGG